MKARILFITVASATILVISLFIKSPIKVIYNPSTSAPTGIYLIVNSTLKKGDYVLANIPEQARMLAVERQYLPENIPILKPVAAESGDHICIKNDRVLINGKSIAMLLEQDSKGRELVQWTGCRMLFENEFFLLSTYTPYSYDSRYFGPVTRKMIIGKAVPFWVFEGDNRE